MSLVVYTQQVVLSILMDTEAISSVNDFGVTHAHTHKHTMKELERARKVAKGQPWGRERDTSPQSQLASPNH